MMKRHLSSKVSLLVVFLLSFTMIGRGQNVTVNPGAGSYATLKAAFDAINAGTHTGAITVDIVASTAETSTAILNASGSGAASYSSILIKPSGGAAMTISGAIVAGSPLIDLNGADNVTIDGLNTMGNSLTIANTTVATTANTSTIRFIGGATNNVITNCSVQGSFSGTVASNGGNIIFATDAGGATGNDNNTISNNNIGPAGSNLPSKAISSIGTTSPVALNNSGITIANNNIFDFFGAIVPSAGIYLGNGTTDWNIEDNRLYQTNPRTQTTGTVHACIQLTGGQINDCLIDGNSIGFANAEGTGTYTFVGVSGSSKFYPINISAHAVTTPTVVSGNTIANMALSGPLSGAGGSAPFAGIVAGSGFLTISGNTIGHQSSTNNISIATSSTTTCESFGISISSNSNVTVENNTIGGFTLSGTSSGGSVFIGIRAAAALTDIIYTISNNSIGGSVAASISNSNVNVFSRIIGIANAIAVPIITGNTIRNMTMSGSNNGTGASSAIIGISQIATSGAGFTISNNSIHSLSCTNTSAATTAIGIHYTGPTAGTHVISKNIIHSIGLSTTSTSAELRGINIAGGTSTISNNMVRIGIDESGASITTGFPITGIYDNNTVVTGNAYYYNTSYVGGTGVTDAANTWAFRSDGTTNTRNWRNNIFHNARANGSGTGKHFAIQCGGSAVNPPGLTSNRNNLRASGTGGIVGFYDGAEQLSLSAWSTATGQDLNSVETTPDYINETGNAASVSLKIDVATGTALESGGVNITGITTDFENNIRQGNGGYSGTGTAPDIGADEFEGTGPACTGAPIVSNALVSPTPPFCSSTVFTLSLDQAYAAAAYQWQQSPDNATWNDIPGATFATLNTSTSTTTYYRNIVTCTVSNQSTPSNSVQVTVLPLLSGVYTINNTMPTSGTNYNNFSDAVDDLNCRGIGGDVRFDVSSGQVFSSADSLNILATGSMEDTVAFVKSGMGANPKIVRTGNASSTNYIVRIMGGDYFTFDGIDFEQSGNSSANYVEYGIYLQNASAVNGAQHNTFKNGTVTLTKESNTTKGVYSHSMNTPNAASGTNSYNRFLNMTITNAHEGYRIDGASNTFPETGNEIGTIGAGMSNITMLGNGINANTVAGIIGNYQQDFNVHHTTISNLSGGGTSPVYGITMQSGNSNAAVIVANHIHTVSGAGDVAGIIISQGDTSSVYDNQVNNLATSGNAATIHGILISSMGMAATIFNNRLFAISSTGSLNTIASGLEIGAGDIFYINNNMISEVTASTSTNSNAGVRGIASTGSTVGQIIYAYYNSIALNDVGAVSAYSSAAFYNGHSNPSIDFRNNMIINACDVTTGTRAAAYWKNNAAINQHVETDNNLYYAGTPSAKNLLYYDGTNASQTISELQAISGMNPREAFSVSANVSLDAIVNGTITPDATIATAIESGAAEIAGWNFDYENELRGPYPLAGQANGGGIAPDIGADEGDYTYLPPAVPDCPTLNLPVNGQVDICTYSAVTLIWTPASTGGAPTGGYDVYFGNSPSPPFVGNTLSTLYPLPVLEANTTYYWKVISKNSSGESVGCATYSFSTIHAVVTATTPGSHCGPGAVPLSATGEGTLRWYAGFNDTEVLAVGDNFTTPLIYSTTDFYVAAGASGMQFVLGPPSFGSTGTDTSDAGLLFDVIDNYMELSGVHIYPVGTGFGTVTIVLKDIGGVVLYSTEFVGFAAPEGIRTYVPLGWSVIAGNDYYLEVTGITGEIYSLIRDLPADIVGGPIAANPFMHIPGIATITSGREGASGTSGNYYYFYDWVINGFCESERQPVTATITPSEPIVITPTDVTRCLFDPATTLSVSSEYNYTEYTWSPTDGLNTSTGTEVMTNPLVSTTYTVSGDDGTCASTATIVVTVNQPPSALMASATPNPTCVGPDVNLYVNANAILPYLVDGNGSATFIDISATGDPVPGTLLDNSEHTIAVPSFLFNGIVYTNARIGVNGCIMLGSTSGDVSSGNEILPSEVNSAGNIFLAPYWDDLDVQASPTIKTQMNGPVFIIQYSNFTHNDFTTGSITFQVQLNTSTGEIAFVYADVIFGDNAYDAGANATVGLQYSATEATPFSEYAAILSNGQCITFTPRPVTYSWSGPGGYTSSLQNPVLLSVDEDDAGWYTVTCLGDNGCASTASVELEIGELPGITPGMDPAVCAGITTAPLTYTSPVSDPDQYSITFSAEALAAGFVNVVNAVLPASPIGIAVPGGADAGSYMGMLVVSNSVSGCEGDEIPITVTVRDMIVTNDNNSGDGSLRELVDCAGDGAVITFAPALSGQTITLTSGELMIDNTISILGLGSNLLFLSGNNASRIFYVQSGNTLTLQSLSLVQGASITNGGALVVAGQLILTDVQAAGNAENGVPKAMTVLPGASIEVFGAVHLHD